LPSLAIPPLILLIIWLGSVSDSLRDVLIGLAGGLVFYLSAGALINAALVPDATFWRIVPVSSTRARKLSHRLRLLAGVCGVFVALFIATAQFRPYGDEFYSIANLAFSSVIALLLSTLLKKGLWQASAADGTMVEDADKINVQRKLWAGIRLSLIGILILTLGLALYGYSNLASFTLSRIVLSAVLIGGLLMLRRLLHELLEQIYILFYPPVTADAGPVPASADDNAALAPFWLGLAMDLLLVIPALMLLLGFWGVPQTTVYLWGRSILEGFTVGELTFSLGRILLALLIFGVVFLITRLLRHVIRDQLLTQTHLDAGIKHSVSVGIVYLGSTIALLLAVATLGVSLNNLALIFGALSVGVGLGLQNVVNNFVSGLVLLIQRPIRVGDWIIVDNYEGLVKNVNVISTEIETFDKASILIPNSDILSNALVNWTHNDRTIRIIINVGVAYGSATRQVHDLLLECARQHEAVLSLPQPYVLFTDFGDNALNFELRAYVGVDNYFIVASDLRFYIEQALREADISIPFPQRELHIKQSLSSFTPAKIPEPDPEK
jgi:small-conductance mechanosensitive channel